MGGSGVAAGGGERYTRRPVRKSGPCLAGGEPSGRFGAGRDRPEAGLL